MERLTTLVASLSRRPGPRRSRSRSRARRPTSPTPSDSQPPKDSLCWYHAKFGEAARKCKDCAVGKTPRPDASGDGCSRPLSQLFFVSDCNMHTRFLVDTGSEVSVILPTPAEQCRPPDPLALTAVNNTSICTYGQRSLSLDLGLRRLLPWIFIIADVKKPILGADFSAITVSWSTCTNANS